MESGLHWHVFEMLKKKREKAINLECPSYLFAISNDRETCWQGSFLFPLSEY